MTSETDIGNAVSTYLQDMGWDVYPEVTLYGRRADIVARLDNRLWVVECKRSLGLSVIDQAVFWVRRAHYVSIAALVPKRGWPGVTKSVCQHLGIGALGIESEYNYEDRGVRVMIAAPLHRNLFPGRSLGDQLCEGHKLHGEPGMAGGGYWTPFNEMVRQIKNWLRRHPGSTIKETIDSIDHHYASDQGARGAVMKWINDGVIKGIRIDDSTKPYKLYLEEK